MDREDLMKIHHDITTDVNLKKYDPPENLKIIYPGGLTKADYEAIKSDWEQVGKDIESIMLPYQPRNNS